MDAHLQPRLAGLGLVKEEFGFGWRLVTHARLTDDPRDELRRELAAPAEDVAPRMADNIRPLAG